MDSAKQLICSALTIDFAVITSTSIILNFLFDPAFVSYLQSIVNLRIRLLQQSTWQLLSPMNSRLHSLSAHSLSAHTAGCP